MKNLLVASLLAVTACSTDAAADTKVRAPTPAPTVPVGHTGCLVTTVATTVIFGIEQKSDAPKVDTISTFKVMSNGAWTYVASIDGKQSANRAGCMDRAQLDTIKALAGANWKTTMANVICDGFSRSWSEYLVNGKQVLTRRRICDGHVLAPATEKSLADATRIVSTLTLAKP